MRRLLLALAFVLGGTAAQAQIISQPPADVGGGDNTFTGDNVFQGLTTFEGEVSQEGLVTEPVTDISVPDSGDGNPGTLSWTPTAKRNRFSCLDVHGCQVTVNNLTVWSEAWITQDLGDAVGIVFQDGLGNAIWSFDPTFLAGLGYDFIWARIYYDPDSLYNVDRWRLIEGADFTATYGIRPDIEDDYFSGGDRYYLIWSAFGTTQYSSWGAGNFGNLSIYTETGPGGEYGVVSGGGSLVQNWPWIQGSTTPTNDYTNGVQNCLGEFRSSGDGNDAGGTITLKVFAFDNPDAQSETLFAVWTGRRSGAVGADCQVGTPIEVESLDAGTLTTTITCTETAAAVITFFATTTSSLAAPTIGRHFAVITNTDSVASFDSTCTP